jgi:hypothetical protein
VKGLEFRRWLVATIFVASLAIAGSTAPAATAAGQLHAFDPVLSLTGSCEVSQLDEVPDPGPCPGVSGVDHPTSPFNNPRGVATDFYGDIYVASSGPENVQGQQGRIIVFDSSGHFITEFADPNGPGALVVDSEGSVYVANGFDTNEEGLVRYDPSVYEPAAGNIGYGGATFVLAKKEAAGNGLAINPLNDHLFRRKSGDTEAVLEYNSKAEGNNVVGTISGLNPQETVGIAVDAVHGRLYVGDWVKYPDETENVIKVFSLAAPHDLLFTIEESDAPEGAFLASNLPLAADEGTGHLFVFDVVAKKVYEFDQDGTYLSSIAYPFQSTFHPSIAVDNGEQSPNGGLNPAGRYLYVPSHPGGGHTFAFGPSTVGVPTIESQSIGDIGETEATLQAAINPGGLETQYTFQYLPLQQFEVEGGSFAAAETVAGDIPAGNAVVDVTAGATGLVPGTAYRFRVIATNSEGTDGGEAEFTTYPAYGAFSGCPNDGLRTGLSALLPDCRAYELVTPASTNARSPQGIGHLGTFLDFPMVQASPQGDAVSFQIEGGLIPGSDGGTGSLGGDPYLATRGESGWDTGHKGPSGAESPNVDPGATSPDQGYAFWSTSDGSGGAAIAGQATYYVRYPDGHSALIGRGSLGVDPQAIGRLISENGSHIIFVVRNKEAANHPGPAIQLEPNAPPQVEEEVEGKMVVQGTAAIYDRTPDEVTHVVSLLPGNKTPAPREEALYQGASLDGRGVAFKIGNELYLRYENAETYDIGEGVTFAGVAEGGNRIFYLKGGRLYRFDVLTGAVTPFSPTIGGAVPVNVSADGSAAYLVSPSAPLGLKNPHNAKPKLGAENLYLSREGTISFVGMVTKQDVEGEAANEAYGGLGLWVQAVASGKPGSDPSRTTADGHAMLFESRADLAGYNPQGHVEIYRFDSAANTLDCLSCVPTGVPARSDASLESISQGLGAAEPFTSSAYVKNLSADGRRAFFQSTEPLVPVDRDGLQDVYEWEAEGSGSCIHSGGCIYLISSEHSLRTDYLFAASDSGDDVFFISSDILLPRDAEETPSIYDARVGGGFAEPVAAECEGEGCRPGLSAPPVMPGLASGGAGPSGNVGRGRCPKGKHKVRRGGKVRCVKKHRRHHHLKPGQKRKEAPR